MNYIVLDMEWNQPFKGGKMVKRPIPLYGEIIQVGAVKLDNNYRIIDTFKIMVSPQYYTKMHKKVKELTGITTEELRYGFPFKAALGYFKKWCGDEFAFLTWGPDDIAILQSNIKLHALDDEWLQQSYDLQLIFDGQITKENRQISLIDAMEKVGEPALKAHDALHDARNTACICRYLDIERGIAGYDMLKERMTHRNATKSEKAGTYGTYTSRDEALKSPEVVNFYCSLYGKNICCDNFIRQGTDKYISIGKCDDGDELFVRFKFMKQIDGKFSVSRMVYEMNEYNRNYYIEKKHRREEAKNLYYKNLGFVV